MTWTIFHNESLCFIIRMTLGLEMLFTFGLFDFIQWEAVILESIDYFNITVILNLNLNLFKNCKEKSITILNVVNSKVSCVINNATFGDIRICDCITISHFCFELHEKWNFVSYQMICLTISSNFSHLKLFYQFIVIIHIYQISMPSLAPSSHCEFSISILKLNVIRAPGMASIFGIWGLYFCFKVYRLTFSPSRYHSIRFGVHKSPKI